jgi:Arylsulfotransferase (ASST)
VNQHSRALSSLHAFCVAALLVPPSCHSPSALNGATGNDRGDSGAGETSSSGAAAAGDAGTTAGGSRAHPASGGQEAGSAGADPGLQEAGAPGTAGAPADIPFRGEALPGYTLIGNPENDSSTTFNAYLVDLEGNKVHEWPTKGFPPKMFPGGALLGCSGLSPEAYDCARIESYGWDGALHWSFDAFESLGGESFARQHHDFVREGSPTGYFSPGQWPLANGRTLVLAMRQRTLPALREEPILEDVIYELDAQGHFVNVIWESADHFEEFGFDDNALADIRTTPGIIELLHGNALSRVGPNRWFRAGNQAFHPDNLIYSSRQACFVIIISHETGEVVWKIGPDFDRGPEASLGQFSGQHFAHMIPDGLPGAGNMLVLDNGGASGYGGIKEVIHAPRYGRRYSRVVEFDPTTFETAWEYGSESGEDFFYSRVLGSAQRLPNGNTLITVGTEGRVIEVTPEKSQVWSYQYQNPDDPRGWVYRAIRMPPEWLPQGRNEMLANYPNWTDTFR